MATEKLFEIMHNTGDKLLVVAEDIQRVTEVYSPSEIKLAADKVVVIRHRDIADEDADQVKELKRVLRLALETEERHYESRDTQSGWIDEAKSILGV